MKEENTLKQNYIVPQCKEIQIEYENLICSSIQNSTAAHEGFREEDYSNVWN